MYHARPPRLVIALLAPGFISDLREQEVTMLTVLSFAVVLVILGISYQLKVDQRIEYEVCFFHYRIYRKRVGPGDIHKIVLKDAGWGTPAGSIRRKKGFPIRVVNFDSVDVFAELEDFAGRHHIRMEERKYYRTIYDKKKSKERQGA